ncbi:hypothetical protein LZD49_20420 [Dyadobacter sp. CY261]|uniref:hypothetical protein n=1 Tax=Dyadobacter sp. CY261 TaxID=2907203 RepID=UPI001F3293FA|nr:hypothetical protein [Dyadobacter sp. CY261]MCF0072857.1 hypothetical protein [Dyadobacter sp. CY261]
MRQTIFASLLFLSALFISACKENPVETPESESAKLIDTNPEATARIKAIIGANITKKDAPGNARTYGSATWYFTQYGYQYTGSVTAYSFPANVYVSNNNSYPIIIAVTGQLQIMNPSLSCSGGGTCMYDDSPVYYNSNGYTGGRIILGPGVSATLNFGAKIKTTSGVEGWLQLEHIAPSFVSANYTDDYLYVIRGSL